MQPIFYKTTLIFSICLLANAVFSSSPTIFKLNTRAKILSNLPYALLQTLSDNKTEEGIEAKLVLRGIVEQSQILLNNSAKKIPYRQLTAKKIVVLSFGAQSSTFEARLNDYTSVAKLNLDPSLTPQKIAALTDDLSKYTNFLISLNHISLDAKQHSNLLGFINLLAQKNETVVVNFGDIENLSLLNNPKIPVLQANNIDDDSQNIAAQLLFGGIAASGKLPKSVGNYRQNDGETTAVVRFKYTIPEEVGVDANKLAQIDAIATQSIAAHVFPGCQIFIAKKGKVIYNKSFGWHEYNGQQSVQNNDLYDLASVTKCAATTLAVMKLFDEGKLNLDTKLGDFVPEPFNYIKFTTVRDFLTHTSGLPPTLPIGVFERNFANFRASDDKTGVQVAEGVYFKKQAVDSIYKLLYRTPVYSRGAFKYSDANFNLLGNIVEGASQERLDVFCNHIYQQLGLYRTTFKPLDHQFSRSEITPTEQDNLFRYQLLRGYVHDESAALMGGVSGNAGLFSNARELGTIFQLFLNQGSYGGEQILEAATVQNFTRITTLHHRGYGFEKQSPKGAVGVGKLAPITTFGHTGFTGTCAWADPQNELVYVFLSNRVYPNRNNAINRLDIREHIHDAIYRAMK